MKNAIIFLALALSFKSYSFEASTEVVASTLAETIYTTALTVASTETTVLSTTQKRLIAQKIQLEIIEFYQTEKMAPLLKDRVGYILKTNSGLNVEQAIEILLDITTKTLN